MTLLRAASAFVLGVLALAAAVVAFAGCIAGAGYSTRDKVTEAAREYNEGVRWGRYDQAARHVPTDARDFVQRGRVCIVRRQYAEAVKICRLGLLAQPHVLEGRLVLGMALTALARWDDVLAEMRIALETAPDSALAWLLKGEAL